MQALQFLKGVNPLPSKQEAVDLSNKKESSSTSFKAMLDDASKKESNQKASCSSAVKKEDSPNEDHGVVPAKKGKTAENETENQEQKFTENDRLNSLPQTAAQLDTADIGEFVLFGQPVEQISETPVAADLEFTELEDVTATQAVFDPMAVHPEIENASFIPGNVQTKAVEEQNIASNVDKESLPFEALVAEVDVKEAFVPDQAESVSVEAEPAAIIASAVTQESNTAEQKQGFSLEKQFGDDSDKKEAFIESAKSTSKNSISSESKFTIVDNRSVDAKKAAVKEGPVELKAESVKQHGNTLDITFNLNQEQQLLQSVEQNILSTSDQAAAGDVSNFQKMLSNQLLTQAPEFVKAGSIILRDNDNGTINLNLRPDSLGNVKITLHVTDKGIEGQIVVASKEAFEAFSQNMDNLKQSFRQSGFDAANLSLNLSNGSSQGEQFAQGNTGGQGNSGDNYMASKTFGGWTDGGEKLPSSTIAAAYGAGGHQIDVVA